MSANKEIRSTRCNDLLAELVKNGHCVFFTLTTPDVVDYEEIRARWRSLRHELCRQSSMKGARYVMNYEIHPMGHGWHIHGVFDRFVPLRRFLPLIRSFGFGRVDFRRVISVEVADYLTKHCLKAYRGVKASCCCSGRRLRLVNTSRGLPRLADYDYTSEWLKSFRSIFKPVQAVVRATSSFRPMLFFSRLAADLNLDSPHSAKSWLEGKFLGDVYSSRLDNLLDS